MTGLEKILEEIEKEADQKVESILAEAKKESDAMILEVEQETQQVCDAIEQRSAVDVAAAKEKMQSAIALQERKWILQVRQEQIQQLIGQAKETLLQLQTEQYFAVIIQMLEKYLPQEEHQTGSILFSERDRKRLTPEWEEKIMQVIRRKKSAFTIATQARQMDGGFILSYGEIEENCSFEALFFAERERLQDLVRGVLFS